jgi:hypothetical protein
MLGLAVAVSTVLLFCSAELAQSQTEPKITLRRHGNQISFEVLDLGLADCEALARAKPTRDQWTEIFAIHVADGAAAGNLPVLGSYEITNGVLRFQPRFPPRPGLHYRAVFDPARIPGHGPAPAVAADLALAPPERSPATVVERVYPSSSRLPENQLKFYLHFSAPMSQGEAYRHLSLLDAAGKPVDLPFLDLEQELWDRSGKRFTLFFDPGRIKRGLKPREEVGPVLEEGKTYMLVIDSRWPDAQGNPLRASYRKRFQVGPPEDRPIDMAQWRLQAPAADSRDALVVRFPRPLDHALLERTLTVTAGDGSPVPGAVTISDDEKCWRLTPREPWKKGSYRLTAGSDLEDLAGNRIGQPFEIDVFRPDPALPRPAFLRFEVGRDIIH